MLSYLRKIFRKNKLAATPASEPFMVHRSGASAQPSLNDPLAGNPPMPVPRVETAQLQLLAIIQKFPDELRKLVLKLPPPEAMVALPLPTIQKFLPTGSVKMSLASVVRQSPTGTFAPINTGDKRLVEVPLAEIFKRISPAVLKKRDDQRFTDLAAEGFDIFGDQENPRALAPRFDQEPASFSPSATPQPLSFPTPIPQTQRSLQNPLGNGIVPPPGVSATHRAPTQPPVSNRSLQPPPSSGEDIPRVQFAPSGLKNGSESAAQLPADDQPPLVVPLKELAESWPEPIKSEAIALNGTTVALPSSYVSIGLARGKVAFAWGQLRRWMTPSPEVPTKADESTELLLPLRVLAPAFLKHSRAAQQRKSVEMDESIPALFTPSGYSAPPPPPPPEPPADEPQEPEAKSDVFEAEPQPLPETSDLQIEGEVPSVEQPATDEAPPLVFADPAPAGTDSEVQVEVPAPATAPVEESSQEVVPVVTEPAAVEAVTPLQESAPATAISHAEQPKTLGEAFNEADKTNLTPSEIVSRLLKTPGVSGAAVALQEGLVIAHDLPEPMKGEVFAAFLPQIFARLNQYASEMKLGAVEDLLVQSSSGPCHIFRRGQVFFAALGKVGEPLPTPLLRLCADALAE